MAVKTPFAAPELGGGCASAALARRLKVHCGRCVTSRMRGWVQSSIMYIGVDSTRETLGFGSRNRPVSLPSQGQQGGVRIQIHTDS